MLIAKLQQGQISAFGELLCSAVAKVVSACTKCIGNGKIDVAWADSLGKIVQSATSCWPFDKTIADLLVELGKVRQEEALKNKTSQLSDALVWHVESDCLHGVQELTTAVRESVTEV